MQMTEDNIDSDGGMRTLVNEYPCREAVEFFLSDTVL